MSKVFITGASGNVGIKVLEGLKKLDHQVEVYAGVRNLDSTNHRLKEFDLSLVEFDFNDVSTFLPALKDMDTLFLLRPPQISDVQKFFAPLIKAAQQKSVKHIVFLSVQGVENSEIIPHHKIEKLIVESEIPYTFLRPAYFMQNFLTTLKDDLINRNRIYLPAGKAKFTLIDSLDVGLVAARVIIHPQNHFNKAYDLTNGETYTFDDMANKISERTGKKIEFISPNLLQFFFSKRKEKMPVMLILVMIMLHYFPRFQKTPKTTECVKEITGKEPKTFAHFIETHLNQFR